MTRPPVVRTGRRALIAVTLALLAGGVATPTVAAPSAPPVTDPSASSEWPCSDWGMYGRTPARTFAAECEAAALSPSTAPTLVPEWFFKTPKTVTASPAVVDGVVYVGDWSPTMYALDAATGDVIWQRAIPPAPFAPFGPIVSSAAVTDVRTGAATRRLVIFGAGPRLFALDARDGSTVWQLSVAGGEEGEETEIESSPVVWKGIVYVGMDTHNQPEEQTGGARGGLLAVDAATGDLLWKFEPDHAGQSGCASIWSSPTIDAARGHVIAATGNCPHPDYDWGPYQEAVFALDLRTGAPRWSFQPHEPNLDDVDFGSTPNLFRDADGREILGIGNKDARYYALDPATGEQLWAAQVAEPGNVRENFAIGGFIGSTAAGGGRVFGGTALGGPPYYHALDASSGDIAWQGPAGPTYAASAYVNGVVIAGALDDTLRVYDAATGVVLSALPLTGPISSGPAVAGDRVFIGTGTSSSDACAKEVPGSDLCLEFFETVLGGLGGVHSLRVLAGGGTSGGDSSTGSGTGSSSGSGGSGSSGTTGPTTGSSGSSGTQGGSAGSATGAQTTSGVAPGGAGTIPETGAQSLPLFGAGAAAIAALLRRRRH